MSKKTAHKPSWKIIQAKNKIKGKIQLALFVLGLIGLIILLGSAVKFIHQFGEPLGLTNFGKSSWDGSSNLNLVFKDKNYCLVSLDPNEKTLKIVKLPPQIYLEVPGGYGSWQLRSIYNLGETESKKRGLELLKKSFADYFDLPIDGILEISDFPDLTPKILSEEVKANPLEIFKLLPHIKTSLNIEELTRFVFTLREVRFDKISEFELLTLGLLGTEESKEGELKVVSDPQKIDGFVLKNLTDSRLSQERKDVAVFNATPIPGLGQKGAKLISHLGLNVIQVGSLDETAEKSVVIIKNGEAGVTVKRLQQIFGSVCRNEKDCVIISHPTISSSRGQIVIVLGKDFRQ